jgi:hypothetical protein
MMYWCTVWLYQDLELNMEILFCNHDLLPLASCPLGPAPVVKRNEHTTTIMATIAVTLKSRHPFLHTGAFPPPTTLGNCLPGATFPSGSWCQRRR